MIQFIVHAALPKRDPRCATRIEAGTRFLELLEVTTDPAATEVNPKLQDRRVSKDILRSLTSKFSA